MTIDSKIIQLVIFLFFAVTFFGFVRRHDRAHILPNILHAIGQTPLVKLNRIPQSEGIKCEICKYFLVLKGCEECNIQ